MFNIPTETWNTIIGSLITLVAGLVAAYVAVDLQFRRTEKREKSAKLTQDQEVRAFICVEITHNLDRLKWLLDQIEFRKQLDRREPYVPDEIKAALAIARTPVPRWRIQAWEAYKSHLVSALGKDFPPVHDVYAHLDEILFLHEQLVSLEQARRTGISERQVQIRSELSWRLEQQDHEYEQIKKDPRSKVSKVPIPENVSYEEIKSSFIRMQARAIFLEQKFVHISKKLIDLGNPMKEDDNYR